MNELAIIGNTAIDITSQDNFLTENGGIDTSTHTMRNKRSIVATNPGDLLPIGFMGYKQAQNIEHKILINTTEKLGASLQEYSYILDDGTTGFWLEIPNTYKQMDTFVTFNLSKYHGDTATPTTSYSGNDHTIENKFSKLFRLSKEESYEDGMDSELSVQFSELLKTGNTADILDKLLTYKNQFSIDGFAHIIRTLGRIKSPKTLATRIWLLSITIKDKSPIIRDASSLSLSEISEESSIEHIRTATAIEPIPSLKADMQTLIKEWEEDH